MQQRHAAMEIGPILADALMDAGCDDEEVIANLRTAGLWAEEIVLLICRPHAEIVEKWEAQEGRRRSLSRSRFPFARIEADGVKFHRTLEAATKAADRSFGKEIFECSTGKIVTRK